MEANSNEQKYLTAVRVLVSHGEFDEAEALMEKLWNSPMANEENEYKYFLILLEIKCHTGALRALSFYEHITKKGYLGFWERRSNDEQSILFDWQAQIHLNLGNYDMAFQLFKQAASCGRETHLLWWHLGNLYLESRNIHFGIKCLIRSLELYSQMNFFSDKLSNCLGSFTGKHPFSLQCEREQFVDVVNLLKQAISSKNEYKTLKRYIAKLLHFFPTEERVSEFQVFLEAEYCDLFGECQSPVEQL